MGPFGTTATDWPIVANCMQLEILGSYIASFAICESSSFKYEENEIGSTNTLLFYLA
jgi:hypothetical protein